MLVGLVDLGLGLGLLQRARGGCNLSFVCIVLSTVSPLSVDFDSIPGIRYWSASLSCEIDNLERTNPSCLFSRHCFIVSAIRVHR